MNGGMLVQQAIKQSGESLIILYHEILVAWIYVVNLQIKSLFLLGTTMMITIAYGRPTAPTTGQK